jgi:hypothetical protein
MLDGTVGSSAARLALSSRIRSASASLPGSTANAKRRFDSVYSCAQYTSVSSGRAASLPSEAAICAGVPSNRRPQPPREQRVAAEQPVQAGRAPDVGDMAQRMAGHVEHVQFQVEPRHGDGIAFAQRHGHGVDAVAARAEHGHLKTVQQRRHAANVVSMVMGE